VREFLELLRTAPRLDDGWCDAVEEAVRAQPIASEDSVGAVIDSSVFIAAVRGKLDLNQLLAGHGNLPIGIAAITASELLHGVHRAVDPDQRR